MIAAHAHSAVAENSSIAALPVIEVMCVEWLGTAFLVSTLEDMEILQDEIREWHIDQDDSYEAGFLSLEELAAFEQLAHAKRSEISVIMAQTY